MKRRGDIFRRKRGVHLRLGRRGENDAATLLRRLGFDIVVRNWRCAAGELDIVARDGAVLVFVEVKTRSPNLRRTPEENLGPRQCRRNLRAARSFLRHLGSPPVECRFELIAIVRDNWGLRSITRHRNYLPPDAMIRRRTNVKHGGIS